MLYDVTVEYEGKQRKKRGKNTSGASTSPKNELRRTGSITFGFHGIHHFAQMYSVQLADSKLMTLAQIRCSQNARTLYCEARVGASV